MIIQSGPCKGPISWFTMNISSSVSTLLFTLNFLERLLCSAEIPLKKTFQIEEPSPLQLQWIYFQCHLDSVILLFMLIHHKSSVLLKIYIKKDVHHALLRPPGTSLHRPKSLHLVTWHSRCSLIHKARYVLHSRIQIQTAVFSVHENSHDKHNHVCDDMYLLQAEVACRSSGAAEGLALGKG